MSTQEPNTSSPKILTPETPELGNMAQRSPTEPKNVVSQQKLLNPCQGLELKEKTRVELRLAQPNHIDIEDDSEEENNSCMVSEDMNTKYIESRERKKREDSFKSHKSRYFSLFGEEILSSRVDKQRVPAGSSSLFGKDNGHKDFVHVEDEIENGMYHRLPSLNTDKYKRVRSNRPMGLASPSFNACMKQMQNLIHEAKMTYEAKTRVCDDMSRSQQSLLIELQYKDDVIQQLHNKIIEEETRREEEIHQLNKKKIEEENKRKSEIYRLESELQLMGKLLEGYRKALKSLDKQFAEYRAKCLVPEEPIYVDAGSGGLVLTTTELKMQKLTRDDQEEMIHKHPIAEPSGELVLSTTALEKPLSGRPKRLRRPNPKYEQFEKMSDRQKRPRKLNHMNLELVKQRERRPNPKYADSYMM